MVFLLLVFFMCVSSLSQAGHLVELDLPESTASETPKDLSNRIILSIQDDGDVYLGGAKTEQDKLESRLRDMRDRYPEIKLRIRADQSTKFQHVKQAMSAATQAGISDYIYGTIQGE
jgi:biopolymer transport protein ExbD